MSNTPSKPIPTDDTPLDPIDKQEIKDELAQAKQAKPKVDPTKGKDPKRGSQSALQLSDNHLLIFKAISTFAQALNEEFGSRHKPLALYCRLVEKTTLSHEPAILKHINAFKAFCTQNRDCILRKDPHLVSKVISYSDRVYIELGYIFGLADKDTASVIWDHILTIEALVDPTSNAKKMLTDTLRDNKDLTKEDKFLADIISKVESNVTPTDNPMEAVNSIMQSGVFTDLIGSMNKDISAGELDFGKLMGTVTTLVGKIGAMGQGSPEIQGMANMVTSLTSMMSGLGGMGSSVGVSASTSTTTATVVKVEDVSDVGSSVGDSSYGTPKGDSSYGTPRGDSKALVRR